MSFAVGIHIWAIIAGIKKHKAIKKKKRKKKLERIVLFGKDELNIIYILISKALIYLCINHSKFVSANNALRENYEMKEEIKNLETSIEYII